MRIASNKIADVVRFFREELAGLYDEGEIETFIEYCFEEFLNIKRTQISLKANDTISESELLKFNFAVKDLKNNKPIQYILGKADFYGLKFLVNEHVLIPRQETEELVHLIINENLEGRRKEEERKGNKESGTNRQATINNKQETRNKGTFNFELSTLNSILDIGTGSGCIPIVLKNKIPEATVYAMDISEKALEVAQQNAGLNGVEIGFLQHDVLSGKDFLSEIKFDVIVSNPPYIRDSEKAQMHKNVLDNEPHLALFVNDNDPLLFYKAIADIAIKKLNKNGKIYFEINEAFGLETKQMLESKGFQNVMIVKDLNNKNRILRGDY